MSIVYTELTLKNEMDIVLAGHKHIKENEVRQLTVQAIAGTGRWTIIINEETRDKLGLRVHGIGELLLADGKEEKHPMAGPLEIWWKNRRFTCDAFVIPDAPDILLGAFVLFAMDLTINPLGELVGVHGDIVLHRV